MATDGPGKPPDAPSPPPPPPPPSDSGNQKRADDFVNPRMSLVPTAEFQKLLDDFSERKEARSAAKDLAVPKDPPAKADNQSTTSDQLSVGPLVSDEHDGPLTRQDSLTRKVVDSFTDINFTNTFAKVVKAVKPIASELPGGDALKAVTIPEDIAAPLSGAAMKLNQRLDRDYPNSPISGNKDNPLIS